MQRVEEERAAHSPGGDGVMPRARLEDEREIAFESRRGRLLNAPDAVVLGDRLLRAVLLRR